MVSFFGLKFKDKKKKAESKSDSKKSETKESQGPKRIDQNTLGEGQFFGLNPKTTGVINGSLRSVSRAGTPQPGKSPYADTHNLAAASMFDLGNVPSIRAGTPTSLHLRPNASEMNLRGRFGENNSSVTSLGLPAPGFASRPASRPGSSSGKTKAWVNPLDVHFMRATPTPPPALQQQQPASSSPAPASTTEQGESELSLDNIADAVINSVNREEEEKKREREKEKEAERQKETARLELEMLERQRSTETILAPKPASPGQPQTQSPTRSQPESGGPTALQGPGFQGNVDQRPDSRNGTRGIGPSTVHQGPPPTGPPTQSLPQPPGQGPSRQSPHPPAIETFGGRPAGPLMAPRPNGPGGPGLQISRSNGSQDPNAPRGGPSPGPQGSQSHGPIRGPHMNSPHQNSPHTRGPPQGLPRHGSPQGPPRHVSPSQRSPFGPPQGPPRHGSPSQRHGPHGPPPPNDVPETPATEQGPAEPLISSLTSPTASTSASTARSSVTDELLNQLGTKTVIQEVSAKRDTVLALNNHSLSMKIEELEQTLLAQQAAKVEEMPQLRSLEVDPRRTSSSSSYYSVEVKDDDDDDEKEEIEKKPTLAYHPSPLRIPSPVGVSMSMSGPHSPSVSTRNDSQISSPSSSTHSYTSQLRRDPTLPTPDTNRPSPVIDTGFNFDFGPGVSTPLTPDSSNWPLSSPTTEKSLATSSEEAKFSRSNVPPPLNLKFNFSPDASSRGDPGLAGGLSLLTPPLRSAPPTFVLNDGRPSTSSGLLAASPSLVSRTDLLNDESFMGIGMARGPSIREVRRPGTSNGHNNTNNNKMVDSFGTGFI
ncbi:hypothetical protein QBC38DRAFT_364096 [Podospora fimiseda]|uniref:Uncharacterized protein n=1 Tax=Podospora fimiseda TaxID=252190 RepID=A0AAN7BQA8_9PEZI|nr:hypothetical protein QBC38DRAFT_364096 [Podospora fimiseda]